jgi:hypothetical protein
MENILTFLYILLGLLLRLAIPIAGTLLIVLLLRKLDARWQAEAELQAIPVAKSECWKVKGCSPEQMQNCSAGKSPLPCWQVNRLPNGYLHEGCLSCPVFLNAPVPTMKIEPRSL